MKFHKGQKQRLFFMLTKKLNANFMKLSGRPSFPCHVDVRKRVLNHNNELTALSVEEDDAVVYSYD